MTGIIYTSTDKFSSNNELSDHGQAILEHGIRTTLPELYKALIEDPVLDGFDHAGEVILQGYIADSSKNAKEVLLNILSGSEPSSAADIVQLLSRFKPFDSNWRSAVVQIGLYSSSFEMRDAGIQAVENWEEDGLVALLKQHKETDGFLRDYANQVVKDLEG